MPPSVNFSRRCHISRAIQNKNSFSQTVLISEDKMFKRAQIGSRPPRCERKCSSCGHCEAIQVPTNPQFEIQSSRKRKSSSKVVSNVAYARGDGNSNYKTLSWKCKCVVRKRRRQSLLERQKVLQQEQDRLLHSQTSLYQKEDYIFSQSEELNRFEKELAVAKRDIEEER